VDGCIAIPAEGKLQQDSWKRERRLLVSTRTGHTWTMPQGRAQDKEAAQAISKDIKYVIEKGRLQLRETAMSSTPLEKFGELRKALG
jgi:hypothetical protein